jgi:CBS domain-containing protein
MTENDDIMSPYNGPEPTSDVMRNYGTPRPASDVSDVMRQDAVAQTAGGKDRMGRDYAQTARGDAPMTGSDAPTTEDMVPPQRGMVRDIMTPAPVGVYYSQTIGEAARVMRDAQVGAVLVVNEGALAGVVTDRDLVVRGLADDMAADAPVGPLCSGDLVGVAADASLEQAQQLMREHAVRRLPVIAEGQVVGIVSMGDIAITAEGDSPLAAVSKAEANT